MTAIPKICDNNKLYQLKMTKFFNFHNNNGGRYMRLNPEDQICKNQRTEFKKTIGPNRRTEYDHRTESINTSMYTFGLMVIFGPSVKSYGFLNSVLQFLYIRSSGFGLMYQSILDQFGFVSLNFSLGFECFDQCKTHSGLHRFLNCMTSRPC